MGKRSLAWTAVAVLLTGSTTAGAVRPTTSSQVVEPFIDGMTIHTSDSVANVEVRAKSFGPGGCAVEFSTVAAKIGFVAPPLTYSSWTVLTASVGKNSFELHNDVKCDTGVVAQVRYYAERPRAVRSPGKRPVSK